MLPLFYSVSRRSFRILFYLIFVELCRLYLSSLIYRLLIAIALILPHSHYVLYFGHVREFNCRH